MANRTGIDIGIPAIIIQPPSTQEINHTFTLLSSAAVFAIFLASYITRSFSNFSNLKDRSGNDIPNGPIGLPIIGSFPFLTRYPELALNKWAQKFGDLYSVWLGNQLFLIISSPQVAKDLLVSNGSNFSSRKDLFIKAHTVFVSRGVTATPYNETWKKHRRLVATWLHAKEVDKYSHVMDREATDLIQCLFDASKNGTALVNPQPFAGRCALNNMLTIVFGTRTVTVEDPMVKAILKLSREFMNLSGPMSNLIDFVPILQHLPTSIRSRGRKLHQDLVDFYGGMIKNVEKRMQNQEEVPDCLAKAMVSVQEEEKLDELDIAMLTSAFMIGGVESTTSLMQWFCALIPSYPEIQQRAQEELDRVVGRDRLPGIEDEKNLPYCHAIVKEIERCHNPFWLGSPHYTSNDFTYKGKFIPKDTVMVLNTWTMHHDEKRHKDPMAFNPDRYLDDNLTSAASANQSDPNKRDHWMFGAGRRICPGMWVAERELWLSISRMIWAFNMEAVPGLLIDLKEYDGLSGRSPIPFQIYLKPRHENVGNVLKSSGEVNF